MEDLSLNGMLYPEKVFSISKEEKTELMIKELNSLHAHHYQNCPEYRKIIDAKEGGLKEYSSIESFPYISVRLFKLLNLKSVKDDEIFKTVTSSGTTGNVSKIYLDKDLAALQSKTLLTIMQNFVGTRRLPMLLCESNALVKNKASFSARSAGAIGFSFLGRKHTYLLNEDMELDEAALDEFFNQFKDEEIILFGFTFMLYKFLIKELVNKGKTYPFKKVYVIHGGGWKKLQAESVSNDEFKSLLKKIFPDVSVHNFYGMAEQTGSIYVECECGHLHTPAYSDVIIRDPVTFKEVENGKSGLVQVVSLLPKSYPGFSILTEDLGIVEGDDLCPCGRHGRFFRVLGRAKKSEVRGCSDTFEGK